MQRGADMVYVFTAFSFAAVHPSNSLEVALTMQVPGIHANAFASISLDMALTLTACTAASEPSKTNSKFNKIRILPKTFKRFRMRPDASECVPAGPNGSENF